MVVSKKESPIITIFAEQIRLEEVKEYKYLGSWITENGDCLTAIKRRIGVAKSFFWKHKEPLKRKERNGKRDKGRQRRTWIDDLKDWTGIKNFGALKRTVEDRVKWKFMVSNLRVEDGTK